jgi:hypothetical protein
MKFLKTFFTLAFTLLLIFTTASCSSDDDNDNSGSGETFISFNLNGTDYNFNGGFNVISAFSGELKVAINGNDQLDESDPNNVDLAIFLPDYTVSSGTFPIANTPFDGDDYDISFTIGSQSFLGLTSGTVTITSNQNGLIEGSFEGVRVEDDGTTSLTVTDGSFRAVSNPD